MILDCSGMLALAHLGEKAVVVSTSSGVTCYGKVVAMTNKLVLLRDRTESSVIKLDVIDAVKVFRGAS